MVGNDRNGASGDETGRTESVRPAGSGRVVLVEDDDPLREALTEYLVDKGLVVAGASDGKRGLDLIDDRTDVVVTDLKLPGMNGLDVLRRAKAVNPDIQVIVATGFGSVDSAVAAMREGAYHYVTKPINPTVLLKMVEEIVEKRRLRREVAELRAQLNEKYGFDHMIGRSRSMLEIFEVIRHVAPTRATVLITGESGTGKELVARAIHHASPRRAMPFIAFNCAALPSTLVESELFGHEKGAFTGAFQRRQGLFGAADGGTLLIDEVSDLDIALQAKLLRVLEERCYTPLGSTREIKVDVRIIAASNSDLAQAVRDGRFREDLFYRLKVVQIQPPPLRERREDIPLLAKSFLEAAIQEHGLRELRLDPDAVRLLQSHDWPGNVRELKNTLESAAVLARADVIGPDSLPFALGGERAPAQSDVELFHVGMRMDELERSAILATLEENGGNRTRAARMLGISLRTLQRKLREYNVQEVKT
ncbi:MAG: sigma-54-dependent Fis family transcriptional regulator [Planctomycetes bacterium]|nr:sigma-54-dependent Fis family transcriptional regulator [Planctomycetota bacterium]